MALSSSSTADDMRAAYLDNMGYEAANSLGMAQAFLAACLGLQLILPMVTSQDRGSTTFDKQALAQAIDRVRLWISLNPNSRGGGTGRYLATDEFRGCGGSVAPDPGGLP